MAKITAETAKNWKFETKQLHIGQEDYDPVTDSRAVPIYQTTSFVFRNSKHAADRFGLRDAGNIYGRLTNPTEDIFERRIAALEGGIAALSVASGAAAITYAIQNVALSGDHIVAARNIYGGTYNLLAHTLIDYNIETTFVDPLDPSNFEKAIKDNTKALYIETLGNPNGEIVDIEAVAEIAHSHGIPVIIDNTFATPYLLRPIEHGADIVIMVHPDMQYTPKLITAMASMIATGLHPCVLGSRILGGYALKGGMPLWKYVANRFLTLVMNILLGTKLSEFHTGYRAFSADLIRKLPLDHNTDDFAFDAQMLAEIAWCGGSIGEVSCPTVYIPEASSINFRRSCKYGLGCLGTSLLYRLCKWRLTKSAKFPNP